MRDTLYIHFQSQQYEDVGQAAKLHTMAILFNQPSKTHQNALNPSQLIALCTRTNHSPNHGRTLSIFAHLFPFL